MEYLYAIAGLFLTSLLFAQVKQTQFLKLVECYQGVRACPIWDIPKTTAGRI